MQYHLNGFRSGDPSIALADPDAGTVCDEVDVLIVGCGPAGLTLATQLAAFPEITAMLTDCQRRTKFTSTAGEKVHQLRCAKFVHRPARRSALI